MKSSIAASRPPMGVGLHPKPQIDPALLASSPAPECFARSMFYDPKHQLDAIKLLPGEYSVTTHNQILTTVLGSCVSACIRDTRLGIGGMNHFMLPDADPSEVVSAAARYGNFAMETMINHLLKLGARRQNLEAKLFGGGHVLEGMTHTNVGDRNAEFAVKYLQTERIPIVSRDLGDVHPRKVVFFPATGRALVKLLRTTSSDSLAEETRYRSKLVQTPVAGDIELF